jgi:integrase
MRVKLTDATIRSYKPGDVQYSVGDAACPGLCLRITPKGVKSFAFAYRSKITGKVTWLTIGHYPVVTLALAREIANDARKIAAAGGDPTGPTLPRGVRTHKKTVGGLTYADAVARYDAEHLATIRSGGKRRQTLDRVGRVYSWSGRPIAAISEDDAHRVLHDIAMKRGKRAQANETKKILNALFKWAKRAPQKLIAVNPFADLPAPGGQTVVRERVLSAAEIVTVWRALDTPEQHGVTPDAATALRLILVTACRPSMAREITGAELFDLKGPSKRGPHWLLAERRMKKARAFVTPLSPLALDVLRPWLKADPAACLFDLRPDELHEAGRKIVAALGMERWTPHDLRRTAGALLDRDGYENEKVGHLLAHTRRGVTATYTPVGLWTHFDMKREMAGALDRMLRETLDGKPEAADKIAA